MMAAQIRNSVVFWRIMKYFFIIFGILTFVSVISFTVIQGSNLLTSASLRKHSAAALDKKDVPELQLRNTTIRNDTNIQKGLKKQETRLQQLRWPNEAVIVHTLFREWPNKTALNNARLQLIEKKINQWPNTFTSGDAKLYLRINGNETEANAVRTNVSTSITRCETMQIVHSNIEDHKIEFESKLDAVQERNQSDCIEMQDSCAIVGNSGILLNSACGDVIDSADFVIRNNLAPFGNGYASDVGSRMDTMTINLELIGAMTVCAKTRRGKLPSWLNCKDLMTRIKSVNGRVLWFFKRYRFAKEMKAMLTVLRKKYHLNFSLAYSPIIPMTAATRFFKVRVPSSGLAVYMAATQFCKSISLFGFYPLNQDPYNRTVLSHYYGNTKSKYSSTVHAMSKEHEALIDLDRRGAIRLILNCSAHL